MQPPFAFLVGLDFRDAGGYAFAQAARLSHAIPCSHLHLVHVFESPIDQEKRKALIAQLRLYVNEKAAFVGGLRGVRVGIHLRVGDPVREMVQLACDIGAKMIVVGVHERPQLKHWLLGSVTRKLIASAPCPVLVAGPDPEPAEHTPVIEPPCPDCARVQAASKGASWWCERHATHAVRAHAFSYQRELPLESHDSEVIPTGIDFDG
jgi:nucleotide-binding universal stress UspA family protein